MADLAKGRHTATQFALGAALGVLVFLAVYGVSPLDVANDAFCRGGYIEKDIQQHYAGWLFYRENAIGFPFCVTKAVNAPAGVSVAYTDSIPLLAALLRPVANALGGTFQYFGWFTLTSFALQGGFGALLCGLFCESVPACAAGSLLFSASPILIERAFRHTSLGAQWLVLAAFSGLAKLPRGTVWVMAAVVVQLWDISPALIQRHEAMVQAHQSEAFPTTLESNFWQAASGYEKLYSVQGLQDDALHLALFAADNGMTTNDPFAARYDDAALENQRAALLAALADGQAEPNALYLFEDEGNFLQAVEPVRNAAWCGKVTSQDGSCNWYVIAPGLQGQTFDALCTLYDDNYSLRLADYTDALWNRGVLDSTRKTVCFKDSPFTRRKLENAQYLCADGQAYRITELDDHDAGWLMVTLDINDATILWDQELTTQ